ncbi:hypothetical protein WH50_14070, partial [Pokkaliibacter plantistimulans]
MAAHSNPAVSVPDSPHPIDQLRRYIDALETAARGIQSGIDDHAITGENALNLLMAIADQLKREARSLSVLL